VSVIALALVLVSLDAALEVWRFVSRFRRPDAAAPEPR